MCSHGRELWCLRWIESVNCVTAKASMTDESDEVFRLYIEVANGGNGCMCGRG